MEIEDLKASAEKILALAEQMDEAFKTGKGEHLALAIMAGLQDASNAGISKAQDIARKNPALGGYAPDASNRGIKKEERRVQIDCCITIVAKDWLEQPDVIAWIAKKNSGAALFAGTDIFTTYDHGEGPSRPDECGPDPGTMPQWLWNEIVHILRDVNLDNDYCVVRLAYEE